MGNEIELLPCPFCGGRGMIIELPLGVHCRIVCSAGCGLLLVRDTEQEVVEAWNTRTETMELADLKARVERYERMEAKITYLEIGGVLSQTRIHPAYNRPGVWTFGYPTSPQFNSLLEAVEGSEDELARKKAIQEKRP